MAGDHFSHSAFNFFIQAKNGAIGRRLLKIGRCGKGDAAADEGLGGFSGNFRAAEQTEMKINAADIPKL